MCICVVLVGVLVNDGNLMYILVLLCSSFTSKMLVICVDGGRLVERFRGNFFFSGTTILRSHSTDSLRMFLREFLRLFLREFNRGKLEF